MHYEERYMQHALKLAEQGLGKTAPNPMVGACLVMEDRIVADGYHVQYGQMHAEPAAIHAMADSSLLPACTLYVTLEPCSHKGKTPPCTDLIIRSGIKRVVIGSADTNSHVSGHGAEVLRNAGIEVIEGVLEKECRTLNKRFFTYHEKQRPYILLKWAMSADGFIDGLELAPMQISGPEAQLLNHTWRSQEQAILVGTKTAIKDNPQLNSRLVDGKDPLRVLIDKNLAVPSIHHLLNGINPTLVFTAMERESQGKVEYQRLDEPFFKDPVPHILYSLYLKEIQSLIVEGGAQTLNLFIENGLWDEARVFTNPKKIGQGVAAPKGLGIPNSSRLVGTDRLDIYLNS